MLNRLNVLNRLRNQLRFCSRHKFITAITGYTITTAISADTKFTKLDFMNPLFTGLGGHRRPHAGRPPHGRHAPHRPLVLQVGARREGGAPPVRPRGHGKTAARGRGAGTDSSVEFVWYWFGFGPDFIKFYQIWSNLAGIPDKYAKKKQTQIPGL